MALEKADFPQGEEFWAQTAQYQFYQLDYEDQDFFKEIASGGEFSEIRTLEEYLHTFGYSAIYNTDNTLAYIAEYLNLVDTHNRLHGEDDEETYLKMMRGLLIFLKIGL